jgi:hypothetical protein
MAESIEKGFILESRHVNYDNIAAPGTTDIVNTVNLTNVAFTVAAQPDVPRNMVVTVVDTTGSIVAGTLTIVGTDVNGQGVSEAIDCSAGAGTYTGNVPFARVGSVTASGFTVLGGAGDETIAVGSGGKLGLPTMIGGTLNSVYKSCVGGVDEAVGTVSTTYSTIIPTSTPDNSKDFDFWYVAKYVYPWGR